MRKGRRSRVVHATPGPIATACLTVLMAPDRAGLELLQGS